MLEHILEYLDQASGLIKLFAVTVIITGFSLSIGRYIIQYCKIGAEADFSQFRIGLGRVLVLSLEILVVADVINTITVVPTFKSLSILSILVLVRTLMTWTLTLEINGHWPWQRQPEGQKND